MNCQCVHENVCRWKWAIPEAFGNIIRKMFGGMPDSYYKLEKLVQESCIHRTPKILQSSEDGKIMIHGASNGSLPLGEVEFK